MSALARALVFTILGSAIVAGASPDQWKGLIIGEATMDQARAVLGNPKKESAERLYTGVVSPLLGKEIKGKNFTKLQFEKTEEFSHIDLYFLEGKLVALILRPDGKNKILAKDLSTLYEGAEFEMVGSGTPDRMYQWNQAVGRVQHSYPSVYTVAAVTERTIISAVVSKATFGNALKDVLGADDEDFPGKADIILYFSRTLGKPVASNRSLQ